MEQRRAGAWFTLWVLFAINTMNFFDRQILGAVGEPVRREWGLSDGAMGALGTAFTLLYAFVGVPLGRLADRSGRKWILSAGVLLWSLLTVASGAARNFWQLFVFRLGVGVGEASCARGAAEAHGVGARRREGSPYRLVLGTPTMRWLILSGALHNFNMYAIGSFLTPFLMRYHGSDIRSANFVSMVAFGLSGAPGLILGGMAADAWAGRRSDGRLLVGALAILGSVPLLFLSLGRPGGDLVGFMVLMGAGCALM